jgi:hypothetical protein
MSRQPGANHVLDLLENVQHKSQTQSKLIWFRIFSFLIGDFMGAKLRRSSFSLLSYSS